MQRPPTVPAPPAKVPREFTQEWANGVNWSLMSIARAMGETRDVSVGIITMPKPPTSPDRLLNNQVWVGKDGILRLNGMLGNYVETFANVMGTVTVTHNLGTRDVLIAIWDSLGNRTFAAARIVDDNSIEVTFGVPFSGRVVVSGALPYGKYATSLTGAIGTRVITHNLGTRNVLVGLWDSNWLWSDIGIEEISENAFRINFQDAFTGRVVVIVAGVPPVGKSSQVLSGVTGTVTINHNLGTQDIIVGLWSDTGEWTFADIQQVDQNSLDVTFQTVFSGRVVVMA